jgi:hypothetical protein
MHHIVVLAMAQNTSGTDESKSNHPAAGIETIVVNADDVVAAMKRNDRDSDQQRSHVLRLSPQFDGTVRAKPHVSEDGHYYPPEVDPTPIHLSPESMIIGHDAGSRHPEFGDYLKYPSYRAERSNYRQEYDLYDEAGEPEEFSEEDEDEWDEWWNTAVQVWEEEVRHKLQVTESITLTHRDPNIDDATVELRVETEGDDNE